MMVLLVVISFAAAHAPPESTNIYALIPRKIFNVTSYGAIADGKTDNVAAFRNAWQDACKYEGISIFWVPLGIYYLGPIEFHGPCYGNGSPRLEIRGTLRAPPTLEAFIQPTWILFDGLSKLYVSGNGTGLLDAQGEAAWKFVCPKNQKCRDKPIAVRLNRIAYGEFVHVSILNSKNFHMQIYRSRKIRISNVTITSPEDSPNTDGIHIGECAYVNITSSRIGVGDLVFLLHSLF